MIRVTHRFCLWVAAGFLACAGPAVAEIAPQPCLDDPTARCLAAELGALIAADPAIASRLPYNERQPMLGYGHIFTQTGQDGLAKAYLEAMAQHRADEQFPQGDEIVLGSWFAGAAIGHAAAGRHEAAAAFARAAPSGFARSFALSLLSDHYLLAGDPPRAAAFFEQSLKSLPLWKRLQSWLPGRRAQLKDERAERHAAAEAYRRLWAGEAAACAPLAEVPGAASIGQFRAVMRHDPEAQLLMAGCEEELGTGPDRVTGSLSRLPKSDSENDWPLRFRRPEAAETLRRTLYEVAEGDFAAEEARLRVSAGRLQLWTIRPRYLSMLDVADVQALTAAHLMLIDYEAEGWRRYRGALADLVRRGDRAALLALIGQSSPAVADSLYGAWENVAVHAAMEGDAGLVEAIVNKLSIGQNWEGVPCIRHSEVEMTRLLARVLAEHGHAAKARRIADLVSCPAAVPPARMDVALRTGDRDMKRDAIEVAYAMEDSGERAAAFAELASMMLAADDWGPAR